MQDSAWKEVKDVFKVNSAVSIETLKTALQSTLDFNYINIAWNRKTLGDFVCYIYFM